MASAVQRVTILIENHAAVAAKGQRGRERANRRSSIGKGTAEEPGASHSRCHALAGVAPVAHGHRLSDGKSVPSPDAGLASIAAHIPCIHDELAVFGIVK